MSLCVMAVSDPAGLGTGLAISLTWHGPTVRSADLAMSLCVTAVSDPAGLATGLAISLLMSYLLSQWLACFALKVSFRALCSIGQR